MDASRPCKAVRCSPGRHAQPLLTGFFAMWMIQFIFAALRMSTREDASGLQKAVCKLQIAS
jgi:hypothetical protein